MFGPSHPCYLPIYLQEACKWGKKTSCPLYPILDQKETPTLLNPHPSRASYQNQNIESDRQHLWLQPSVLRLTKKKSSWFLIKFINTAGLPTLLGSSSLSPLHIFVVGPLCQAGIVGTLGWVALASRARRSRLTVGAGVSWLSLGSGLSRASVFAVTRHTCWAWNRK